MKPIKLTMQAFGPYANIETINFTELDGRTMFVISGKTGAGKTTVFDAISFALYGKTSGEERSPQELRSHFADEDLITEVDFTFELKKKVYRIVRSPMQERKKSRGEGTRLVNSNAEMYVIEDGKEVLAASSLRETDEKVQQIMQLDFNQFRQILMIPQGEFRKLLTSDSTDKELILQKLFHTKYYRAFQDQLKNEARELKQRAEQYQSERMKMIGSIDALDDEELQGELLKEPINEAKALSLAKNLVATQNENKKNIHLSIKQIREKMDHTIKEIERANFIKKSFEELDKLKTEFSSLEQQKDQISQKEQKIEKADQAQKLIPFIQDLELKKKEVNLRRSAKESAEKELTSIKEQLVSLQSDVDHLHSLESEIDQKQKKLGELEKLEEKLNRLTDLNEKLQSIESSGKKGKTELTRIQENISNLESQKLMLEDKHRIYLEEKSNYASIKHELYMASEKAGKEKELNELRQLFDQHRLSTDKLRTDLDSIELKVAQAEKKKGEEEKKQSSFYAAYLADELTDGEPCKVCGSLHHPKPAEASNDHFDIEKAQEEISSLKEARARMDAEYKHAKGKMQELEQRIKELQAECSVEKEPVIQVLNNLKAKEQKLMASIRQSEGVKEQLQNVLQQLSRSKDIENRLSIEVQQQREQYVSTKATITSLAEEIPDAYFGNDSYVQEIKQLKQEITTYQSRRKEREAAHTEAGNKMASLTERVKTSQREVESAKCKEKESADSLYAELQQSVFESKEEAVSANMHPTDQSKLEREIRDYHQQLFLVKEKTLSAEKALEGVVMPDAEELKARQVGYESEMKELEERFARAAAYVQRHEELIRKIEESITLSSDIEERYRLIGWISDTANGQNERKLTFERFVLSYYLDDILITANDRLLKMSSGRYELARKEDRSKGNKQSGLELLVWDHYTGQTRHVKTLSGGEAFKASLSLALGLADVVQSYAGGVSLETMFIDEGFGTLDPESLDQAIESLMEIQAGGRLVGVISHVPELKERIDARLEVTSTNTGSSTRFLFESL
ncbi:AAA family ATPase [Jeotgalibacillus aurantiacus]|uniref:AAA family ATPase n=1 Tax=Jeotgalibacillus aurantiacus TaxID=2763266 RepID=UPI001D0B7C26|nr:SMC family ATPase [Jeotgalibacillus aurantiacus]